MTGKPLAVLIIEDSDSDAALIVRELEKNGYAVESDRVDTDPQLEAALARRTWDIAISDYRMPQLNAEHALRRVQEKDPDLPFLIVSGSIGEEIAVAMMKAGAHDYLMKGNLQRLAPAVERELEQAHIQRERRLADLAVRESEKSYRLLAENIQDVIWILDLETSRFIYVSPSVRRLRGYTPEEVTAQDMSAALTLDSAKKFNELLPGRIALFKNGNRQTFMDEVEQPCRDGSTIWTEVTTYYQINETDGHLYVYGVSRDIAERRRAEQAIRESEERYRLLVDQSPYAITIIQNNNVVFVNKAAVTLMHAKNANELLGRPITDYIHPDGLAATMERIQRMWKGEPGQYPIRDRYVRLDGVIIPVEVIAAPFIFQSRPAIQVLAQDITDRVQAEQSLRESEERYRLLVDQSPYGITVHQDGKIVFVNKAAQTILHVDTDEQLLGLSVQQFVHPDEWAETGARIQKMLKGVPGQYPMEERFIRPDGVVIPVEVTATPFTFRGRPAIQVIFQDITERKAASETLHASEERYRLLAENTSDTVWLMDMNLKILYISPSVFRQRGFTLEELNQLTLDRQMTADSLQRVMVLISEVLSPEYLKRADAGNSRRIELEYYRKDGSTFWADNAFTLIFDQDGKPYNILGSAREITEQKHAEDITQRQLRQFAALRNIDNAIRGSLDLRLTLSIVLREAVAQLGVDAARILIMHPHSKILEYAAGTGFRTTALQHAEMRLGQGFAGQAALDQRVIHVPDLRIRKTDFLNLDNFAAERFVTYCAVPLVTKGQVIGVMEVFCRTYSPLEERMGDWQEFLETIADQAAIAVENTSLFSTLQQTNIDLTRSVDEVLECWAHALDVREKESPGHTRTVTEEAVRLAKAIGMSDPEILLLRRGALLHDIGKMAIPDSILLKTGPLAPEEAKILQRHPVYAYEMLSLAPALRPVLDIPYCHHEKWDGSGYPRGLQGERIPLPARIFTVVDAWDLLVNEKPGNPAMSRDQAIGLIRAQSEADFDPKILAEYLQMKKSERSL
jgi:PAS domain S-box-containing protein